MTNHTLTHRTICALLLGTALWVIGEGALNGQSPGQMWFTEFPATGTPVDIRELTRYPQLHNSSSTLMTAALGQICILDGATGAALNGFYPLGMTYRNALNFTVGPVMTNSSTNVLIAGPAVPSDLPLVVYAPGPPAVHIGDLPMQGMTFGFDLTRGDASGDGVNDTFVTAGPGGPPTVFIIDTTRSDIVQFTPFENSNFRRIAAGNIDGVGGDELVVANSNGEVRVFTFTNRLVPTMVGGGVPFPGQSPEIAREGVWLDVADLNNNRAADLLFGTGTGPAQVRAFGYQPGAGLRVFADFKIPDFSRGAEVEGYYLNGQPLIAVSSGPEVRSYAYVDQVQEEEPWKVKFRADPFGRALAALFNNLESSPPPARR